uniref:Uncharacterized protein n=1 Tax=Oryza nivara TaxID=4536 RepID=A0A0E0G6P7_ORYNI
MVAGGEHAWGGRWRERKREGSRTAAVVAGSECAGRGQRLWRERKGEGSRMVAVVAGSECTGRWGRGGGERERGRERGAVCRLWSPAVVTGARAGAGGGDDDGRWGRWRHTPAACRLLASRAHMRVSSSPRRRSPEQSPLATRSSPVTTAIVRLPSSFLSLHSKVDCNLSKAN